MMALVSQPDLCLVMAFSVWTRSHSFASIGLSQLFFFFYIKVNECKQGEKRVAAAVKDAVQRLAPL